jgi:hypothetical protein
MAWQLTIKLVHALYCRTVEFKQMMQSYLDMDFAITYRSHLSKKIVCYSNMYADEMIIYIKTK